MPLSWRIFLVTFFWVIGPNNFTLNLYVRLDLFDDLGDKEGEDKQANREENLKRDQFGPVAGRQDIF